MYEYWDIASQPSKVLTTADETIGAIASICQRAHAKAWLFGSHAKGSAHFGSDIDVAVLGDDFDSIEESVEALDTVFLVDLVDLSLPHKKGIEDAWISIA